MTVGYWLTKYTLGITLKILFRSRAWGVKNMPRRGPVILASNHLSFSDHFFGPFPVPRKVIFLGKSEYFTGRGLKGLISRAFFTGVGVIPLDRAGGPASEQAIRTGLQVLVCWIGSLGDLFRCSGSRSGSGGIGDRLLAFASSGKGDQQSGKKKCGHPHSAKLVAMCGEERADPQEAG